MRVAWELPSDDGVREQWLRALPSSVVATLRMTGASSDGLLWYYQSDVARGDYGDALNALVIANLASLVRWQFPPLYEAGVRYAQERCGEVWRTIPAMTLRGVGDCDDLAAARVAELNLQGVEARVLLRLEGQDRSGGRAYHVLVALPDGGVEDPSLRLGMGWNEAIDRSGPDGQLCLIEG